MFVTCATVARIGFQHESLIAFSRACGRVKPLLPFVLKLLLAALCLLVKKGSNYNNYMSKS